MARDQEKFFESKGIDTYIVRGDSKIDGEGHVWVAINNDGVLFHIDSVGWYPFAPELLFDNIEIFENYESYLNRNK